MNVCLSRLFCFSFKQSDNHSMLELKERYRIGKKQNREDHRFFSNLHGDNDVMQNV